ncbi:MAG: ATP-binding protein [Pyrinomonadaceae bacterium]
MADPQDWKPIQLSAKVFGHISQGLYRTPAGAIKELISNAFDADASTVKMHTGFPRFESFSCEDNGTGISREEFHRLMERGVGTSFKRAEELQFTPTYHRRVIGRLGIGILSLAQICTQFDLISHHAKTDKAFIATIRFPPYTRQEIDRLMLAAEDEVIKGGEYRIEEVRFDSEKKGVRIYTKYLREAFRKRMSDLSRYSNLKNRRSKRPYDSFENFIKSIYESKDVTQSLSLASDYDQLLFNLAMIPPNPYFNSDSNVMLKLKFFQDYEHNLEENNFNVFLDNLNLRRPVRLPSDQARSSAAKCKVSRQVNKKFELVDGQFKENVNVKKYEITVAGSDIVLSVYQVYYSNQKVGGRPLQFWGYLFQQTGRLYPRDTQGVLVRVRDVAIGSYDTTLMSYPYGEGPRYHMVSSELMIEQGFEDALNIDRDSFNALDPHYLRMQAYLHSLLHSTVFPETWSEEKTRNKARKSSAQIVRDKVFLRIIKEHSKGRFLHVQKVEIADEKTSSPVRFSQKDQTVVINTKHPAIAQALKRRKYHELVQQISIVFEQAIRQKVEKQREEFYELLAKVFDNQP